jgi:hypothetical protein
VIKKLRFKLAVRKANRRYKETGYHYMVILYKNKFLVKSRRELKELVKQKYFRKGFTVHHIDRIALYSTYHTLN